MAVIYQRKQGGTLYEVRQAGASVRLYSNGVLHSQFNPQNTISGAIWDLLILPAFMLPKPPESALILGLGGGTLVHLIQQFFPQCKITCVEIDPTHIHIAKRFFKVKGINIVKSDAYGFLKQNTDKFDWIIDDVFDHTSGDPVRQHGLVQKLYQSRLNKNGLLSINVIDDVEGLAGISKEFSRTYRFQHPLYDNQIYVFGNHLNNVKTFYAGLRQHKCLNQNYKTCRLKFDLSRL
ncbi:hypothetical protein [Bermanella sp. R86510]|uniref:spermine/spermidine synthase domain-containing protein n=1 Tax=unclassified Bermanella TaxID=2627862 RepID=UPI0037C7CEC5